MQQPRGAADALRHAHADAAGSITIQIGAAGKTIAYYELTISGRPAL